MGGYYNISKHRLQIKNRPAFRIFSGGKFYLENPVHIWAEDIAGIGF